MSQTNNSSSNDHLNEILAEYLQAVEAGEPPNEEKLLEEYPEFADELREFFADKRKIDEIAKPDEEPCPQPPDESSVEILFISPGSVCRWSDPDGFTTVGRVAYDQCRTGCFIDKPGCCRFYFSGD